VRQLRRELANFEDIARHLMPTAGEAPRLAASTSSAAHCLSTDSSAAIT
jgi:hypothetical protein